LSFTLTLTKVSEVEAPNVHGHTARLDERLCYSIAPADMALRCGSSAGCILVRVMKPSSKIDFSSRADLREALDRAALILSQNSKTLTSLGQNRVAQRKVHLALLKLSSLIRRKWRESLNEGSRVDLRILLEDVQRSSIHFSHIISDPRVVKALELSPVKERIRHELHEFLNKRVVIVDNLQRLSPWIPIVVEALNLSGKDGRSGPFHTV
jgi:hypothetical protein